jgi:multidrug efflux pump subunit AcrA (membrane-fusion protein)
MNGSKLVKPAILILIAAAWIGWQRFVQSPSIKTEQSEVSGEVVRGNIVQRVTMVGSVQSRKRLLVKAPYRGFVRKTFVRVGDSVKVGTPLVSIAQTSDQPDSEIFPLRSTMNGIVTQIQLSEGEAVSEGGGEESYILRVDDLGQFTVVCDVPEVDVIKIKSGQKAIVKASAMSERPLSGEIGTISMASAFQDRWNRGVVQFKVEVIIKEPNTELRPGMTAMVDVTTAERQDVLTLRHEFIEPDSGKYWVTLVDGSRVQIKVGLQDEESFEVVEGLQQGQKVRQVDFVAISKLSRGASPGGRRRH